MDELLDKIIFFKCSSSAGGPVDIFCPQSGNADSWIINQLSYWRIQLCWMCLKKLVNNLDLGLFCQKEDNAFLLHIAISSVSDLGLGDCGIKTRSFLAKALSSLFPSHHQNKGEVPWTSNQFWHNSKSVNPWMHFKAGNNRKLVSLGHRCLSHKETFQKLYRPTVGKWCEAACTSFMMLFLFLCVYVWVLPSCVCVVHALLVYIWCPW